MNHPPPSKSLPHSHSSSPISSPSPSTSSPPLHFLPSPPSPPTSSPTSSPTTLLSSSSFPPFPPFPPSSPSTPPSPNGGDRTTSAASAIHIHHLSDPILGTSSPLSLTFAPATPCPWPSVSCSSSSAPPARPSPSATAFFSSFAHLNLSSSLLGPPLPPPPRRSRPSVTRSRRRCCNDDDEEERYLIVRRLHRSFPNLTSLILYARYPSTLNALLPLWSPRLRRINLVCRHRRAPPRCTRTPGTDLLPLFRSCPALASLDFSCFYYWTEDVPAVLDAHHDSAASLAALNLLCPNLSNRYGTS